MYLEKNIFSKSSVYCLVRFFSLEVSFCQTDIFKRPERLLQLSVAVNTRTVGWHSQPKKSQVSIVTGLPSTKSLPTPGNTPFCSNH